MKSWGKVSTDQNVITLMKSPQNIFQSSQRRVYKNTHPHTMDQSGYNNNNSTANTAGQLARFYLTELYSHDWLCNPYTTVLFFVFLINCTKLSTILITNDTVRHLHFKWRCHSRRRISWRSWRPDTTCKYTVNDLWRAAIRIGCI